MSLVRHLLQRCRAGRESLCVMRRRSALRRRRRSGALAPLLFLGSSCSLLSSEHTKAHPLPLGGIRRAVLAESLAGVAVICGVRRSS